ncbi:MAG: DUF2851 family protein [Ignavibacteria bacterium]|jgi:hypothetical protein|nr:DUF2851 family protein [Ignavibacteria bacterium]
MKKLSLNENFISRIWTNPEFYGGLQTTDRKSVEILKYGVPNSDSGADFSDALVKIGGNVLSGDIEIHKSVKDWRAHRHTQNKKYNRVVLHVVFWNDGGEIPQSENERQIPTVILSEFLKFSIHEIWREIINNPSPKFRIPCYGDNKSVSDEEKKSWLNELGAARLRYRAERMRNRLAALEEFGSAAKKNNWERLYFEFTLEALGFSKNKNQFLALARIIDLVKLNAKCKTREEYDAVFFGSAGFLEENKFNDGYPETLFKTWNKKHPELKTDVMDKSEWQTFRLRPKNSPVMRIAAASAFAFELTKEQLFKRTIMCFKNSKNPVKDLRDIFLSVQFPEYWKNHGDFGKHSAEQKSIIGRERIFMIFVNVILPLVYLYSKSFGDEDLFIKIKKLYNKQKDASKNSVISAMMGQYGIKPSTVSESQGMIHLHNFYCVKQNCGECKIGEKVFDKYSVNEVLRIIIY